MRIWWLAKRAPARRGRSGQWTIGYADPLTLPATAPIGGGSVAGWGSADADAASYVVVNTTGAAYGASPGLHLAANEIDMHPGNGSGGISYVLLNWTAPRAGTIGVSTAFEDAMNDTATCGVWVGKNYSWFFNGTILPTSTTLTCNAPGISVVAGDVITIDIGNDSNSNNLGDHVGVFQTITYAPEPSSMAILVSALVGLFAMPGGSGAR